MESSKIENYTKLFKVLSNPIRLKILLHIAECKNSCHKHNISELSEDCDVDFSVVSRHLKSLKDAKILKSTKNKNDVIYEIDRADIKKALSSFLKKF
jgi:DNA-binding transcriptional ArsR family regulator